MDLRDKLIDLLGGNMCKNYCCYDCEYETNEKECIENIKRRMADHLIANGVTVQEWISVTERLPTIHDADADNCVLAIHKASNKRYYHWRTVADNPFDFTCWSKVPESPKGD